MNVFIIKLREREERQIKCLRHRLGNVELSKDCDLLLTLVIFIKLTRFELIGKCDIN